MMYKFKIKKQGTFDYILPFIPLGIVILLSMFLSAIRRPLGISETVASVPITVGFVGAIGFVVWYILSPQGEIRLDEQQLVVYPFLRKPVRVDVPYSDYFLGEWWIKTNSPKARYVGPVLVLKSDGKAVTIGCMDSGYRIPKDLVRNDGQYFRTCQFIIEPKDFMQLLDYLKSRS